MTLSLSTGFYLRTFGARLDARVDGEPIAPKRAKKAKLLLALLAAHHHHDVSREWGAARLWPDSDPISGAHNLRQTLSDLRQSLGSEAARIVGDGRNLRLDVTDTDIDVVTFDKAIAKGDPESLQKAVGVYAGPFLEGIDEPWIIAEREPRHRAVLAALDRLACDALKCDDVDAAIVYRRKAIGLAPLDEVVLRNLLIALRASGDHAGMVDALRAFEKLLAKEDPFARPSAETMELVRETRAAAPLEPRRTVELPDRPPLPIPLTELIGREDEVEEIAALLRHKRLITLTGPGGVGKTRLALAVANAVQHDFHNGAVFVDLAAIGDPEVIPTSVASSLSLADALGRTSAASVIEHLRDAQILIVLDNCEHVIDRVASFTEMLLCRASEVRVLATSREPLRIAGERVSSVQSLSFPMDLVDETDDPLSYSAIRLFIERADDSSDHFSPGRQNIADIVSICKRLDGIPLALELAAVMVATMDLGVLASALDKRFELLTHGDRNALPRHRTLRGVIDWGYDLLTEPERLLLRRLGVFTGAWSIEDAAAVCVGTDESMGIIATEVPALVMLLVRKSFVVFDAALQRYRLLETMRQYAIEQLNSAGELTRLRNLHRDNYHRKLVEAEGMVGKFLTLGPLHSDLANIRSAMDWSIESSNAETGIGFCSFLAWFAGNGGVLAEGRARFNALLARADLQAPTRHRAQALHMVGWFSIKQADIGAARQYLNEALDVCLMTNETDMLRTVLIGLVEAEQVAGNIPRALEFAQECLRLTLPGDLSYGMITTQVGTLMEMTGAYEDALEVLTQSVKHWDGCPTSHSMSPLARIQLASVQVRLGRLDEAKPVLRDWLKLLARDSYTSYFADANMVVTRIALSIGRVYEAAVLHAAVTEVLKQDGYLGTWECRPDYLADCDAITSGLSEEELDRACAEARAMSHEAILDYAMAVVDRAT